MLTLLISIPIIALGSFFFLFSFWKGRCLCLCFWHLLRSLCVISGFQHLLKIMLFFHLTQKKTWLVVLLKLLFHTKIFFNSISAIYFQQIWYQSWFLQCFFINYLYFFLYNNLDSNLWRRTLWILEFSDGNYLHFITFMDISWWAI
jgi:hypothetical protein